MSAERLAAVIGRLQLRAASGADVAEEPVPTAPDEPRVGDLTWADLLRTMRVPTKFHGVRREQQLPPELASWTGTPWCVSLLGATGTGKTWTAVRLLLAMWEREPGRYRFASSRPRFADCSLAIEAMRQEKYTPNDGRTFAELERAPVLLLDDYGAEKDDENHRDMASLLLRSRYNEQRPTIVTSNVASLEAIAQTETRIASRLVEGIVLTIGGRDRRVPRAPGAPR